MRVLRTAASTGTHPKSTPLQHPHGPAPAASYLNQSNVLSLPVVTDSKKVLWWHLDEACQQLAELDTMPELVEALNTFPYPTRGEMAGLAQRCSLHVDQVRVWFMIQRLRHGMSWDCEDISEVRQGLLPGSASCSGQTQGYEVKEGGPEKRGEKASEGQGVEDSMGGEPEVKGIGVNVAEKRHGGGNEERTKKLGRLMGKKLGRLMEGAGKRRQAMYGHKKKTEAAAKTNRRTEEEPKKSICLKVAPVNLMRDMFMTCPFPSSDDYDHLISRMTTSRTCIVNWFAHVRFRIKNGNNPSWLTKRTCHLIRRRIKYRQKMMALAKKKSEKGNRH